MSKFNILAAAALAILLSGSVYAGPGGREEAATAAMAVHPISAVERGAVPISVAERVFRVVVAVISVPGPQYPDHPRDRVSAATVHLPSATAQAIRQAMRPAAGQTLIPARIQRSVRAGAPN